MAATHRILRQESKGSEIFLVVEVNTGDDLFVRGEWLCPGDVARVRASESAILTIASEQAARAQVARPKQLLDEQRSHERHIEEIKLETARLQKEIAP